MVRVLTTLFALVALGAAVAYFINFVKQREAAEYTAANTRPANVDIPQIDVSILRDGVPVETRSFQITVETVEGGPLKTVNENKTRLQDLFRQYLTSFAQRPGPENLDNQDYVKRELLAGGQQLVGEGSVRGIDIRANIRHINDHLLNQPG